MPSSHTHKKDSRSKDKKDPPPESSSSSSSDIECFSNEIEIKCFKKKHHSKHKSPDSSSSSDSKPKFKLCDIYDYFRNKLLEDENLMIAGSTAYLNATDDKNLIVANTQAFKFNNIPIKYNIDNYNFNAPYYVRESGVYVIFIAINTDSTCQFTIFINGVIEPLTCVGTNSGAGQLISRHMIKLNKDDQLVVRNYLSTTGTVTINVNSGGLLSGNDATMIILKIAALDPVTVDECDEEKFMDCLSHKKKKLFKKLYEKLLCDKCLMVEGFNIHGTFYNTLTQSIPVESTIVFNQMSSVKGLLWNISNPDQIIILEDGVYKIFFLITTTTAAQFSFSVNGLPVSYTIEGSNKGASQISIRSILELKQNDILQVLNHTSASGTVIASQNAGGAKQNVSTILTIFKIAPIYKPKMEEINCELVKHFECYYSNFRDYLLHHKHLQLTGSPAHLAVSASASQSVIQDGEFNWSTEIVKHNIKYIQGLNDITIKQTGFYDIFADIITNESLQIAIFVNGIPVPSTIFGRDSGASRCLMRQFIKLYSGDILTINNYESNIGTVNTAENPGGNYVGQSCTFMLFLLSKCNEEKPCEKLKKR